MSLVFMESFDHIDDTTNNDSYIGKWTTWDVRSLFDTGRFGTGYACTLYNCIKTIQVEQDILIGFAFKNTAGGANRVLFTAKNEINSSEWWIQWNANGTITFYGGSNWTSSWIGSPDVWYYLEAKVHTASSGGSAEVRINGQAIIQETSIDTSNQNHELVQSFVFAGGTSLYYDDIYICNWDDGTSEQGASNNDFFGPIRIATIYPSSGGFYSDFTPSGISPQPLNWQNVDEPNYPNDDTDFNYAPSGIYDDSFIMSSLPADAYEVKAIQVNVRAKKDDVGTRAVRSLIRASGTDYTASGHVLADSWSYYLDIWGKNPYTDALWEPGDFTVVEFGYESEDV